MAFTDGVEGLSVKEGLTSENLDRVHPELQDRVQSLATFAASMGYRIQINSGWRSYTEQNYLYQQSIARKSKYPAAKPGTSKHNGPETNFQYSLAIDINIIDSNGKFLKTASYFNIYCQYGAYWENLPPITVNGTDYYPEWGGRFSDPVHYGYRTPKLTTQLPSSCGTTAPLPSQVPIIVQSTQPSNKPTEVAAAEVAAAKTICAG